MDEESSPVVDNLEQSMEEDNTEMRKNYDVGVNSAAPRSLAHKLRRLQPISNNLGGIDLTQILSLPQTTFEAANKMRQSEPVSNPDPGVKTRVSPTTGSSGK